MKNSVKSKNHLRHTILAIRDALPETTRQKSSSNICQQILDLPQYRKIDNLLVYSPIRNEVPLDALVKTAQSDRKNIFFPKVIDNQTIEFYQITAAHRFIRGKFDILEPVGNTTKYKGQPALIIVPGIAFNAQRHRIGYGKGYYDRFLNENPQIFSIGVGYPFQMNQTFNTEAHDISLDLIISER